MKAAHIQAEVVVIVLREESAASKHSFNSNSPTPLAFEIVLTDVLPQAQLTETVAAPIAAPSTELPY